MRAIQDDLAIKKELIKITDLKQKNKSGFTALELASMRKELEKDVFEFLVQECIKINMKVNQFAISKAEKLNCDSEFIKRM